MTLFKSAFQRDTIFDSAGYSAAALNRREADTAFSQGVAGGSAIQPQPVEAEAVITLEEHEQALRAAKAEAYAQGQQETQARFEAEMAEQKQRLDALIQVLSSQIEEPAALYQPLKLLSLRLAELLVQGELKYGEKCIDQLVSFTLEALEADPNHGLCIELNPEDLELLGSQLRAEGNIQWRSNSELLSGSVRASWGDIAIENLFENRLHDLQQQLQLPKTAPLPPMDSVQETSTSAPKLPDPIDPASGPQPTTTFDENWP
jgi:flagellar biosynthesis/type III secretory pathway protein FliH